MDLDKKGRMEINKMTEPTYLGPIEKELTISVDPKQEQEVTQRMRELQKQGVSSSGILETVAKEFKLPITPNSTEKIKNEPKYLGEISQKESVKPWASKYPHLAAIPPTAWELTKSVLPFGKYLGKEGREELKGEFFPTGTTTDPEKLKEIKKGLVTGEKKMSPYESLAGETMAGLEWMAFPTAMKGAGAVAKEVLPKKIIETMTKPRLFPWQRPIAPKVEAKPEIPPEPIVSGMEPPIKTEAPPVPPEVPPVEAVTKPPVVKPEVEPTLYRGVSQTELDKVMKGELPGKFWTEDKGSANRFAESAITREHDFTKQGIYVIEAKGVPSKLSDITKVTNARTGEEIKLAFKPEAKVEPQITPETLEAQVKGGAIGPLPKYAEGSSINLERLNTTEDVKQFINGLTQSIEEKIGKRRISWEETRTKAEELGWNVNELKKAWSKKTAFSAAEIDAARQTNINAISELHEMLRTLPAERTQYTPEMRAKLLDAFDSVKVTSQVSSEAGRALNIHKRILGNDPEFKQTSEINRVLKSLKGKDVEKTDDLINGLKQINFNNPAEVNRFIYNTTKTKWQKLSDGAFELWINGLLSNPLTHIVNTTSNLLTLIESYPERALAGVVEAGRSKLGVLGGKGKERFVGETVQDAFSVGKGLLDGFKGFLDSMKGRDVGVTKIESRVSPFPEKVQRFLPTRAMSAEDVFFKKFLENSELNRLAYREVAKEKLTGQAMKDRISELLANPTESMLEQSVETGKYFTYNKDLGQIGRLVMRSRDTIPGLKYFIPFVRTPANIAKFSLERTPLNIPRIAYKAWTGELKGGQFSEETARVIMGSSIGATTYLLAKQGYITGGGPKSKEERDEKMRTGWQPYSFHIGDKYYGFNRLEPMGSILGMAADFNEILTKMKEDEKYNLASGISSSITKNISNKTFMQGFSNLMDAISDPARYGEKMSGSLAGSTIPSVVAGITRATDPEFRQINGMIDSIKSRIPGVSETLAPKINVWGEPIERPSTPALRFLSPVPISEEKGTPIDYELEKLKLNLGMPEKKIKIKGFKEVELEPNEYRQMITEGGQRAKTQLNKLVSRPEFKNLDEERKIKEIRTIIGKYREAARQLTIKKLRDEGRLVRESNVPLESRSTGGPVSPSTFKDYPMINSLPPGIISTRGIIK